MTINNTERVSTLSVPIPEECVRGRIRSFIERHCDGLGTNVLEIGSKAPFGAFWAINRNLAQDRWTGIDFQGGHNVDQVQDVHDLPIEWSNLYSGLLCSEVLEHIKRPDVALREMLRVMQPGGFAIFTTLTAFPIHGYPNDYRRWTEAGLKVDLTEAGFTDIVTAKAGSVEFILNDHGEMSNSRLTCPIHVFATARKC